MIYPPNPPKEYGGHCSALLVELPPSPTPDRVAIALIPTQGLMKLPLFVN